MILLQTEEASKTDRASLPYAIDRKKSDLTLQQITRAGIKFLTQQAKNGFFLMVEGGKSTGLATATMLPLFSMK